MRLSDQERLKRIDEQLRFLKQNIQNWRLYDGSDPNDPAREVWELQRLRERLAAKIARRGNLDAEALSPSTESETRQSPKPAEPAQAKVPEPSAGETSAAPPALASEATDSVPSESTPVQNPKSWQEIEITFLSDHRVEICLGSNRENYNYGDLSFQDRRSGKENRAWITLREIARHNGTIPRPTATGRDRAMFQKRIEEIRRKLRTHFGILADPIPLNGSTYQASFKISCGASFDR